MNLITTQQAADRLGVSRQRILALITEGKLPAQKAGRTWIIMPDDLEEFARQPRPVGWPKGEPRKSGNPDRP